MTLQEAYLKAKKYAQVYDINTRLDSCRDFGDFWGFMFVPSIGVAGDGIGYYTINKKTGEKSTFIPPMDFDLWDKSISIPIEQFAEYSVAI
jgi:hypothetical protein